MRTTYSLAVGLGLLGLVALGSQRAPAAAPVPVPALAAAPSVLQAATAFLATLSAACKMTK